MMPFRDVIALSGARVHNLRSVSVQIPHGRFVVCTGVSGSGKSSLAFDTVFAEGLRRCLETLSPGVKHRLELLPRPDFDSLTGLPPVVAVSQRNAAGGPRGTLATLTEIASFLRLLFSRAGTAHCPQCRREVASQTLDQIVDAIMSLETGRKVMILAPRVRGKKGTHRDLFEAIVREGFVRARVDGELIDAASPPVLAKTKSHDVEVVVDRIIVKDGLRQRLLESVALALKQGNATCVITHEENGQWRDRLFSSRHACPDCQISLPELEPRTLNFNSPYGACPDCAGLGRKDAGTCPTCNGERLGSTGRGVTFGDLTLPAFYRKTVDEAANQIADWENVPSPVAARVIPEIARRLEFLKQVGLDYLTLDRPLDTLSGGELQRARLAGALGSGLVGVLYVLDEPTMGLHPRDTERLLRALFALRDQGNTVLVVEHDVAVMSRAEWLIDLGPGAGREGGLVIAEGTIDDVRQNPNSVTGKYLTGPMENGGQATRTIDRARMLRIEGGGVRNLQQLSVDLPLGVFTCVTGVSGSGKSSLVVETLVPLVRESLRRRDSRPAAVEVPAARRRGKSADRRPVSTPPAAPPQVALPGVGRLTGAEVITRLIEVDQSPLGRSSRANPATLSGIWTELRRLLARSRDARRLGFGADRFSLQASAGRCAACRGLGTRHLAIDALPEAQTLCPVCRGARFNPQTLEARLFGKNAAELLELKIEEALPIFQNLERVRRLLQTFVDVGLGYLALGQSAATLSGGESQRVKLACELGRESTGHTLYVLDEPTTGLHPADVSRLLAVLQKLVEQGHSVIVIEHQLDLIAAADWVIDLGPEGGAEGGRLVAEGTPKEVAARGVGHTALALRRM